MWHSLVRRTAASVLALVSCFALEHREAFASSTSTPEVAKWVGKYPSDKIDGFSFNSLPIVRRSVERAIFTRSTVEVVLSNATTEPIRQNGSLLVSGSCEPHNCSSHNWEIVILVPNGPAAICYHDQDLTGGSSRWFVGGVAKFQSAGDCFSDLLVPPEVAAALVQSPP